MFNNKAIIFFCLFFLSSCGTKKVSYRDNSPKKIENKSKKSVNRFFNTMTNEQRTHWYVNTYSKTAINEMKKFGIPASITMAQGILESNSGKGGLAMKSNNHFGIKCHKNWKGKKVYHDDDEKGECFRKYRNPETSYRDHSVFLESRDRYNFLFKLKKDNYIKWANGLKKAGYATDQGYANKLISIIERYELWKLDGSKRPLNSKKEIKNKKYKIEVNKKNKNDSKQYIVKKGDTLYSISKKLKMNPSDLISINNLSGNNISIGQVLKLE
ncbi:MAG: LysM peptidoglycan-binding domain-containing protein [Flavobacteriaceae bacterium]|jgi:flagellum-specific peptidoglycan hydrolase FlgJ|nr:LysM peptidoglycan-binding domain-containing protein [Flavobacteriaceae bacterium]MBT3753482.1 LysM peptidoglycan-binding domain-containing protein [Flavobacteriaceae bacterium]MBT3794207.1 LysM peptidoglycan-binding domain-containing protein [Flavobacteriaceae bacterium]MBT4062672.1 LysM peptidoglycan-binding domain-containing protein [Flavobacteriaceae bacterium]MBT4246636.1 LysM peptidoglycan-binding domain-containing protein [Flavobacteriaceae bacterium]